MASKVIRRSKSDPNYLFRKKVALVDGKLFTKKENGEIDDEVQLIEKPDVEGRFRRRKPPEAGIKRGLRVTKAYQVNDSSETEPASPRKEESFKSYRSRDLDRRHTVGGALTTVPEIPEEAETESEKYWKKNVLINFLTDRYQEYYQSAENVTMDNSDTQSYTNGYTETDLDDTVSEFDTAATGGFRRGGRARSSLPVVRHAVNKSKEKPLGLVYLQYMNETKRALMPNEITGMDTVRALFVRSFKGKLSMEMMEVTERKIYIRDPLTEIFYELENPHEVRDRTVLKIYEPGYQESVDGGILRSSASTPVDLSYHSEPEVDQQVRQRRYHTMTMPVLNEREVDARQRTKSEGASFTKQAPPTQKQGSVANGQHHVERRQQPQPFQRGAPERATVGGTTPQRVPQNQAPFQRGVPGRASATLPRGGEFPRGGNTGPPQQSAKGTQDRREIQAPPVTTGRVNVAPRNRPIHSGSKTLPPGASLEKPRAAQPQPDKQRIAAQKMADQRRPQETAMRHGTEGDGPHIKSSQGSRSQQLSQSYSTSPRRGPPQSGPHTIQGHRSQPDLRAVQNSPSAIQQGSGRKTNDDTTRRIASMEAQIANLAGMVRTALHQGGTQSQGGSPVRTKPQMNGNVQSRPIHGNVPDSSRHYQGQNHPDGPGPRQQPRPGIGNGPSHGGRPQAGVKPIQGTLGYHSAQNSPRPTHRHGPVSSPQPVHRDGDGKETTPKLNLIPAQVEFIPPTGEPTTPNIGYVKTSDDSKTSKTTLQRRKQNGVVSGSQANLNRSIRELREDHRNVRKMHLHMVQQMNDSFRSSAFKIRQALDSTPGLQDHPIRGQRNNISIEMAKYKQKREIIDRDLKQLESQVEKLRLETVNSRSQVNITSVDNLAQLLGNNSRLIAEQKAIFPVLSDKMKAVMEGEMEVVVMEERFLRDEPGILDEYFKRCKKLTGTLYTLKRLAEVQDLQGSKTDLTSESQNKTTTTQQTQHMPIKSQLTPNQSQQTPSNPQPSQTQVKLQTQISDQHQLKSRFASPAQKSRFEQSLREGKKNLRTTLFAQNASHRQKRHVMALYNQEHHDRLTPMVTPEKEARKAATKKKGPPPPPPPRRSSSTVKVSTVVSHGTSDSNHVQETVVERKERKSNISPDVNPEISLSNSQSRTPHPLDSKDQRTKQLKEQYAKLRALQNQMKGRPKEEVPMNPDSKPEEGAPVIGPCPEVPNKEVLIEGKKNLQNTASRETDSIDKALNDLENFAIKAGNVSDMEGDSYTLDTPIIVERF